MNLLKRLQKDKVPTSRMRPPVRLLNSGTQLRWQMNGSLVSLLPSTIRAVIDPFFGICFDILYFTIFYWEKCSGVYTRICVTIWFGQGAIFEQIVNFFTCCDITTKLWASFLWSLHFYLVKRKTNYCQISNIRCTLIGNKFVDQSDVDGALPVGAAPTTSSFSTKHLALMDWAKTTVKLDENHLRFWFGASYISDFTISLKFWFHLYVDPEWFINSYLHSRKIFFHTKF